MKTLKTTVLLLAICAIAGCATVATKSSWLTVETNPDNVKVKMTSLKDGKTITKISPFKTELNKGTSYSIVVDTPNYRSEEILVRRRISKWFWGNILLGAGPVGMVVDYATKDMWRHNKHLVQIDLTSLSNAPDVIEIKVPITVSYENGGYETLIVPITFHKKKGPKVQNSNKTEMQETEIAIM